MITKARVLIFLDWYLPGYRAGGPTRSCANLIEHLRSDFDFSVVTRDADYMTSNPYLGIKSNEWNLIQEETRVYYISSDRLSKQVIYSLLENEEYDFVYLNGIFSVYFTLIPLWYLKDKNDKRVIVASRGMLAESALNLKKWKKRFFLFFAKRFSLFDNVLFHATSKEEATSIRKVFGENAKVHVAPNLLERHRVDTWKQRLKNSNLLKLVSVARIAPEKNIKYALEILEGVKTNVQFDLFGPVYNSEYWDECNEVIQRLPANIKVSFMDSIESEKVSATIYRYDFLFSPTAGENFGHAILQAMSVGVPVIISDKTMWRQLDIKNAGWDIFLADKNKFTSLIEKCSKISQREYDILSKGAFDFAFSYINNEEFVEQNKQLFLK